MKAVNKYIILMVIMLGALIATELYKKPPVDWSETYAGTDKIPFGSYIVFEQLKKLNNNTSISVKDKSPYLYLDETEEEYEGPSSLVIIQSAGVIDDYEWEKMREYATRGNTVFISSHYFNNDALDSLGLSAEPFLKGFDADTLIKGKLVNPAIKQYPFNYPFKDDVTYFNIHKKNHLKILGTLHDTLPNFVEYACGKGKIFLHSNPKMFSNIYLLKDLNYRYTFAALSYLPQQPIIWDEHYKVASQNKADAETHTPLQYILGQPALRWAYYTLLLGVGLFFIFRAKRRQKAIPVITPLANTSLEFAETIGRLYFNKGNHRDIAQKKAQHFIQYIYTRYSLAFKDDDGGFVKRLAEKSGIAEKEVNYIFWQITEMRKRVSISPGELMTFNKHIDDFYNNAK